MPKKIRSLKFYLLIHSLLFGIQLVIQVNLFTRILEAKFLINRAIRLVSEFTLNSTTVNSQNFPDVTATEEGGFIATWTSVGQDGSEDAIVARKFDANGIALTEEKIINSFITGRQTDPEITQLSGGKSVITWTSQDQDGSYWGLYGQILNSYLDDIGNEFIINSETQGIQRLHSADTLSDDRFVVVWENRLDDNLSSRENSTIQGQIFDSNGGMIGNQFQVNTIQQYFGMSDDNSWHEPPQVIGLAEVVLHGMEWSR